MSRVFCGFLVALSLFMLVLNVANLDRAKPPVVLFWLLIGVVSAYKLFAKKAQPEEG